MIIAHRMLKQLDIDWIIGPTLVQTYIFLLSVTLQYPRKLWMGNYVICKVQPMEFEQDFHHGTVENLKLTREECSCLGKSVGRTLAVGHLGFILVWSCCYIPSCYKRQGVSSQAPVIDSHPPKCWQGPHWTFLNYVPKLTRAIIKWAKGYPKYLPIGETRTSNKML